MNTSTIFKKAHALTKAIIQTGDSYSATFTICLKTVYQMAAKALTTLEFRKLGLVAKKTSNGAQAFEVVVGSEADAMLSNGATFASLLSKYKIAHGYIVTGRGKEFDKVIKGDFNNKYQYVYVTKI